MKLHPAAEMFPALSGADLDELTEDIHANGLLEAITLHTDGSILDGRNREAACKMADVEPRYVEWDGRGSALSYVISKNLIRRHLTTRQRSAIAADIANMERTNTLKKGPVPPNGGSGISTDEAARMMGVSRRSIERARKVKRDDPEAHAAAKAGLPKPKHPAPAAPPPVEPVEERPGPRMTVPDGKTAEDLCREGMRLAANGTRPEAAASP